MKKSLKSLSLILVFLFVVFTLLSLLFTDVQLAAFNRGYYNRQYLKYDIPANMDISMEELMGSTEKLLLYMEGRRENLDFKAYMAGEEREFFSERDKLHMVDVKELFEKGRLFRNLGVLYIIGFMAYLIKTQRDWKKRLARYGLIIFAAGVMPIILLIILMNMDFNKYFTVFHELFFTNDLWLLDPNVDTLVNMFPESFFADTAFRIGYYYIAELLVILISSVSYLFYRRKIRRGNKI